jgi:hypothetical protein
LQDKLRAAGIAFDFVGELRYAAIVAAQKNAGKRITLVDMIAAITPDDLLPDGVHPNQAGMDNGHDMVCGDTGLSMIASRLLGAGAVFVELAQDPATSEPDGCTTQGCGFCSRIVKQT